MFTVILTFSSTIAVGIKVCYADQPRALTDYKLGLIPINSLGFPWKLLIVVVPIGKI